MATANLPSSLARANVVFNDVRRHSQMSLWRNVAEEEGQCLTSRVAVVDNPRTAVVEARHEASGVTRVALAQHLSLVL
jgi:hypothetical protein